MIAHLDFVDAAGSRMRRWLVAGLLVVTMHASAGAFALLQWLEQDPDNTESASFAIELAPAAVAPPTEKINLAIGPRTEEVAASTAVAPTQTAQEKADLETPNVKEAPLVPRPEVVVQKQQPVQKPDEKQTKENPHPPQVTVDQAAAAPHKAKAPPPVEAPRGEVAAAPKQGISSKPSNAVLTWQKAVALHLDKHKHYPDAADSHGDEGVATVWVSIDRSGKVVTTQLIASSGSRALDVEALEVFTRSSPLPRPPAEMGDDFSLPIRFRKKH